MLLKKNSNAVDVDPWVDTGSATTIISNPIWVVQTSQAVHVANDDAGSPDTASPKQPKKLSISEAIEKIVSKDGLAGFWRGIGPALVLVVNPVIQYTVFEQLKNALIKSRMARLPPTSSQRGSALAMLNDWDFFFLGAFSKLGTLPTMIYRFDLYVEIDWC